MPILSKVEKIGAKKAESMLNENYKRQRPVNVSRVDQFAGRMLRGEWETNGEPIIIDEDGAVADGQHRLRGVIAANTVEPFVLVTVVTRGVKRDCFDTLDQGAPRSVSDILVTQGVTHHAKLKASLSMEVANHEATGRYDISAAPRYRKSPKEIASMCSREDGTIEASAEFIMKFGAKPWARLQLAAAKAAFCYWLGAQEDEITTKRVLSYLATGKDENHSLLVSLRNWLLDMKIASLDSTEKTSWRQQRQVAAIMLAIHEISQGSRAKDFQRLFAKRFNGTKRNWKYTFV